MRPDFLHEKQHPRKDCPHFLRTLPAQASAGIRDHAGDGDHAYNHFPNNSAVGRSGRCCYYKAKDHQREKKQDGVKHFQRPFGDQPRCKASLAFPM